MNEKKLDKRVIRTRNLLRDSLMELILEKGYDGVTIQDIADKGGLGRATFYLHFKDKEDLLTQSLTAIIDELALRIDTEDALDPPAQECFEHAAENKNLYKVLLASQSGGAVFNNLRDHIAQIIEHKISSDLPFKPNIPAEIISQYQAGALLALVIWWLENDQPHSPETMSNHYKTLTFAAFTTLAPPSPHP